MRPDIPGVAIGRYPEDMYAGNNFDGGNPWPLCTLAIAEALYRVADTVKAKGNDVLAEDYAKLADTFVARVRFHAYQDGVLDEQIDKYSGFMTSAKDLTWNYAAMLTASFSSKRLISGE